MRSFEKARRWSQQQQVEICDTLDVLDAWWSEGLLEGGASKRRTSVHKAKYSTRLVLASVRLARQLKRGGRGLEHAVDRVLEILDMDKDVVRRELPSHSLLWRYELSVDCAFMLMMRRLHSAEFLHQSVRWGWADSSPQKGFDWVWCQFHYMSVTCLVPVLDAVESLVHEVEQLSEDEIACFSADLDVPPDWQSMLQVIDAAFQLHVPPAGAVSSGQRSLAHKVP